MFIRKLRIVPLLVALILPVLACNLPSRPKATPAAQVPVSSQAVQSLQEALDQAAEEARKTGRVDLVITEQQLTSLIALEMQSQGEASINDVQVLLRDGKVTITGQVQQDQLQAPLEISLALSADGAGGFTYTIESAKIGPLPLPQFLLDAITEQVDQAVQENIRQVAGDIYIESVSIAGGQMAIKGHVK